MVDSGNELLSECSQTFPVNLTMSRRTTPSEDCKAAFA